MPNPANIVVYLGSDDVGRRFREKVERAAKKKGYYRGDKVALSPFVRLCIDAYLADNENNKRS